MYSLAFPPNSPIFVEISVFDSPLAGFVYNFKRRLFQNPFRFTAFLRRYSDVMRGWRSAMRGAAYRMISRMRSYASPRWQ